jgi:hypothetical protein
LIKRANKYIEFEVQTRLTPLKALTGFSGVGSVANTDLDLQEVNNDDYEIATEEDVLEFARLLGGM